MGFCLTIARRIDQLSTGLAQLATLLVLLACMISAGNALSRYGFDLSSNAWLEAQWYAFAGCVMLGAPRVLALNEHVRVDLVYSQLGTRGRAWLDLAGTLVCLLPAMALIAWLAWPIFTQAWLAGETSPNAGGLLRWPVKLLLPLGFALMALQGIAEVIKRAAILTGEPEAGAVQDYSAPLQ